MILMVLSFLMLLLFPSLTHQGIKNGLALILNQVIPSLFPFILISNLLQNIVSKTNHFLYIITGFLSGYPLGAKAVSEINISNSKISKQDLLVLCNNPSIAYMLSFIGEQCFQRKIYGLCIYFSILTGNIFCIFLKHLGMNLTLKHRRKRQTLCPCSLSPADFDHSIKNTFHSLCAISTYILLFSTISVFIQCIHWIPDTYKDIVLGLCEITNGTLQISQTNIPLNDKLILITGITSFGGFSVFAQTHAMIYTSDLSIKKYMTDKAIASVIAMHVMYGFTLLFNY